MRRPLASPHASLARARRLPRSVRVLAPLAAFATAVVLLASPVLGQETAGRKSDELSDAQCYGHHREEGFRSMDLFPTTVASVRRGEAFDFELTLVVPWLHSMLEPVAFVNISGLPGARFPGEKEPLVETFEGALSPAAVAAVPLGQAAPGPTTATHAFPVEANATEIVLALDGLPGQGGKNAWELELKAPSGTEYKALARPFAEDARSPDASNRALLRLSYANVTEGGVGEWAATVRYARGTDPTATYALGAQVHYNLSKSTELLVKGPDRMEKRTQHTFSFRIVAPAEALEKGELVYGARGIAHYLHTDPNADDYGNFTKWNTMTFRVGDEAIVGNVVVAELGDDVNPMLKAYGQIIGYSSSFLLVPALVLGGTFGRGTVTWLNKAMGSARRRVLWHNSTSYLLLATAVLHMYLFLVESFHRWDVGIVWGGLSLAAMIGLAVTGAFQRRFVAKWGFERWRFMHFSLGTIIVGFVLAHIFIDGSHLAAFRDWLAGL